MTTTPRERLIEVVRAAMFYAGFANDRFNMAEPITDYLLSHGWRESGAPVPDEVVARSNHALGQQALATAFSPGPAPSLEAREPDYEGDIQRAMAREPLSDERVEEIVDSQAFREGFFRAAYNFESAQDEYVARCALVRAVASALRGEG